MAAAAKEMTMTKTEWLAWINLRISGIQMRFHAEPVRHRTPKAHGMTLSQYNAELDYLQMARDDVEKRIEKN